MQKVLREEIIFSSLQILNLVSVFKVSIELLLTYLWIDLLKNFLIRFN